LNKEHVRLRELAKQIREIAVDPVQKEHAKLWTAVNDNKMIHPVALVRDYGINMLQYEDELSLQIEDEDLRNLEAHMLAEIYQWKHLRCHSITEGYILCNAVIHETNFGVPYSTMYLPPNFWRWKSQSDAVHFEPVFRDEGDIGKITVPEVYYDREATRKRIEYLSEIFDGILPVYARGYDKLSFTPWDDLFRAIGLQEAMYKLIEEPELMLAFVNRYVEVFIAHAKNLEVLGLLNHNNGPVLIGQGGYGYTTLLPPSPKEGVLGATLKGMWGFSAEQIFTSVSPDMTYEFGIVPEKPWAENFGLMYNGCCERLDHKLHYVLEIPNIHKISCSPFTNREAFMEQLGNKAVVSFKADSVLLSHPDWTIKESRDELIDICRLARKYGCSVEVLMKTLININGDPKRLWAWSEMARDVLSNY
jgi:hypothetical protein